MTTPRRICLYTDSLDSSGMGEHMLILGEELSRRHDVTLMMPGTPANRSCLARASEMNMRVVCADAPFTYAEPARKNAELRLCAYLRAHKFEVFHGHAGIGWEGHEGNCAASAAGIPAVIRTEHLPYKLTDTNQQAMHRKMLHAVDRLITVSQESGDTFIQAGIGHDLLRVVRNGIQPTKNGLVNGFELRKQLELSDDARLIFTAGRFTEQKGHRFLLDAVPYVLRQYPNAHFVWAGDGPLMQELQDQITQRGLDPHVHLLGWRNDSRQLLQAADLFVLPSLFEGLPIVILEAMASGTPIVATHVGGTPEAIVDGIHGLLVEPANALALGTAISAALDNPNAAQQRAHAAQKRFEQSFTAARMASEIEKVFDEVLAEKARGTTLTKTSKRLTALRSLNTAPTAKVSV